MPTTGSIWAWDISSRIARRFGTGASGGTRTLRGLPGAPFFLAVPLALAAFPCGAPPADADGPQAAETVYQDNRTFLEKAFGGTPPEPSVLWLDNTRKARLKDLLGHRYGGLRVRYWRQEATTAWILEEIGKYHPITAGFVVEAGRITDVAVLAYRESIGWEIRYPFFTDQFRGLAINEEAELSHSVDNISGATLSVNSMKRMARMALYLHGEAMDGGA